MACVCRYDFFLQSPLLGATQLEADFDWGGTHIWVSTCVVQGLRCFFIEPANGFFAVDGVYGRRDDAARFDFFNKVRPLRDAIMWGSSEEPARLNFLRTVRECG